MSKINLLIIGAGPAGLATAIRAKQGFKRSGVAASVVVIDKAPRPGAHSLSGAVFESACLDELCPGWRDKPNSFVSKMGTVARDEMYFLTAKGAFRIPSVLVPRGMHHAGDHLISLSSLCEWLTREARQEGVEIYHGFSAGDLLWKDGAVKGIRLADSGRGVDGQPRSNFLAGEEILADVTVLADGPRGVLSQEYARVVGGNVNPQVYSVGIKQVFKLSPKNPFGPGRAIHTLGFPNRMDVFGGGFFYSLNHDHLAAGLIVGLDWKYTDMNPQKEFELLKTHPFVARLLEGAEPVAAGAKTIPEGGFFAMPRRFTSGALVVGDAAGFVNMEKIKGIHYAILSGMAAADAVLTAHAQGRFAASDLAAYETNLEARGVLRDMRQARNFRQVFQAGLVCGAPLSLIQGFLPFRVPMGEDPARTRRGARLDRDFHPHVDRALFAALSGTSHREDEPSHLLIPNKELCRQCRKDFDSPCTAFCPTEVYRWKDDGVVISASNCVHCGTCAVKCPQRNITWTPPEGGEGPRYKLM